MTEYTCKVKREGLLFWAWSVTDGRIISSGWTYTSRGAHRLMRKKLAERAVRDNLQIDLEIDE